MAIKQINAKVFKIPWYFCGRFVIWIYALGDSYPFVLRRSSFLIFYNREEEDESKKFRRILWRGHDYVRVKDGVRYEGRFNTVTHEVQVRPEYSIEPWQDIGEFSCDVYWPTSPIEAMINWAVPDDVEFCKKWDEGDISVASITPFL